MAQIRFITLNFAPCAARLQDWGGVFVLVRFNDQGGKDIDLS